MSDLEIENLHRAAALNRQTSYADRSMGPQGDIGTYIQGWTNMGVPQDYVSVALDRLEEDGWLEFQKYLAQSPNTLKVGDRIELKRFVTRKRFEELPRRVHAGMRGERGTITEVDEDREYVVATMDEPPHPKHERTDNEIVWTVLNGTMQQLPDDVSRDNEIRDFFVSRGLAPESADTLTAIKQYYTPAERAEFLDWFVDEYEGEVGELFSPEENNDEPISLYLDIGTWSSPTIVYDIESESLALISLDDWLEYWTSKHTIYLDNMDRDDDSVSVSLHGPGAHEAAEWEQSIEGSNWEAPEDMPNYAYAMISDHPGLEDDLIRDGWVVDTREYVSPDE
jgi:hypothetical protein